MAIQTRLRFIAFPILLILAALAVFGPARADNDTPIQKILVVPPVLHAGQDMAFLQKGVVDMLTSRLTLEGRVTVLVPDAADPNPPPDDAAAVALARKMGADYVLVESLTMLGSSVSTDARVLDAAQGKVALTFGRAGRDQADVIAHVDQLAAQINSQLFGRQPDVSVAPTSAPASAVAAPAPTPAVDRANIYQHPEKLLTQMGDGQRLVLGGSDRAGGPAGSRLLARGRRMDSQILSVSSGDVDGDGHAEIVCVDSDTIYLYRLTGGQLVKMAQIESGVSNIAVDTADLNGNKKAEVFVTAYDNGMGRAHSYVLEWDGKGLQRIADDLRWYFRTVDLDARGKVLVGQRQGLEGVFSPGIYEMGYEAGAYQGVQRLTFAGKLNVFGFGYGPVRSGGLPDVVAYSKGGYIQILDNKGDEMWSSSDPYGLGATALQSKSKDDPNTSQILYLPPSIHLLDVDGDGIQEIVAVKNANSAGIFRDTRLFKHGHLEILKWDQLGLTPIWRTPDISKLIADFTLADVDGDGHEDVVAAVVQKEKNVMNKGSSYLALFKIDGITTAAQNKQ